MIFHNFGATLIGSKIKFKVYEFLVRENIFTSERELARLIGASHVTVSQVLKNFEDMNFIKQIRVGNSIAWTLNSNSYAYNFLGNMNSYVKNKDFSPLGHLFRKIRDILNHSIIKRVILFGSIAEGTELSNSDIDLLILVEEESYKKEILGSLTELSDECIKVYGNKISPQILTTKEASSLEYKNLMESVKRGIMVVDR